MCRLYGLNIALHRDDVISKGVPLLTEITNTKSNNINVNIHYLKKMSFGHSSVNGNYKHKIKLH